MSSRYYFLICLFVAKKGADEEQRLSQLKLALTWDRVDIAQEEIFREDVLWSTGKLSPLLLCNLKPITIFTVNIQTDMTGQIM